MAKRFEAYLKQNNMIVASVDAPTKYDAEREIRHYALMYSQDGAVEIIRKY
jgi:hypothetical protein